jgi:hypothetical protein
MLTAKFDLPKLAASVKKAGKAFGDTNRTAIARVGVQICRELAVSTQVYGKGGAKKKQQNAMLLGICFWREAPETAVGADRRAGKRGLRGEGGLKRCFGESVGGVSVKKSPVQPEMGRAQGT